MSLIIVKWSDECYSGTLERLWKIVCWKRPVLLCQGIIIVRGNTMPHTVRCTCDWLWRYNLEVIVHPSYSPSLISSNFHLFGLLKKHLAGKQFATYASVKQTLYCWLHTLDTDFYYTNIKAMVPWWDNCLNVDGDYMGVRWKPSATYMQKVRIKFLSSECLLLYIL